MIIGQFLFANNVLKYCVELLHQIGVVLFSKTICQALKTNADVILKNLHDHVQFKRFFISYNNINFYKNIYDQWLHNCARLLFYTTRYVYFLKASDGSSLLYLTNDNIDYLAVNNLSVGNLLLKPSGEQYQSETIQYILSITLEKYFEKAIYK